MSKRVEVYFQVEKRMQLHTIYIVGPDTKYNYSATRDGRHIITEDLGNGKTEKTYIPSYFLVKVRDL
jgi:hypothetical protein